LSEISHYSITYNYIRPDHNYLDSLTKHLMLAVFAAISLKEVGEDYGDLIPIIRYLVSELVMEIHTNDYVNGIAEELGSAIKLRLWDLKDEFELVDLINDAIDLSAKIKDGLEDLALARRVLGSFIKLFSIDLSKCPIIKDLIDNGKPSAILQTVLVGLIIAVGGINYYGSG